MPGIERTPAWQAQYGAARPLIYRADEAGLSFDQYYRAMQDAGLSYRRANMLADWRQATGLWQGEINIQRADPTKPISERYTSAPWAEQKAAFNAYVQYEWTGPDGEPHVGMRVIQSDTLLSRNEYEQKARKLYAPDGAYADSSARSFHLRAVTGKPK